MSDCILFKGLLNNGGYGKVSFRREKEYAHRLAYVLHYGPIPDGMLVCHKCDVRHCINPEHLFLGTPKDNSEDMVFKHRNNKGEKHYACKLTDAQVEEIRNDSQPYRVMARKYGVHESSIGQIRRGERRKG